MCQHTPGTLLLGDLHWHILCHFKFHQLSLVYAGITLAQLGWGDLHWAQPRLSRESSGSDESKFSLPGGSWAWTALPNSNCRQSHNALGGASNSTLEVLPVTKNSRHQHHKATTRGQHCAHNHQHLPALSNAFVSHFLLSLSPFDFILLPVLQLASSLEQIWFRSHLRCHLS